MSLLHHIDQATIHREVCVAILDSFLPHGEKCKFINDVGISAQWYSYIREKRSFSMPSVETAQLMAKHLPAPDQYKQALYDHLCEARVANERGALAIKKSCSLQEVAQYSEELNSAYRDATFTEGLPLDQVKSLLMRVVDLGEMLINNLNWKLAPLKYLRMTVPVIHVAYALDRAPSALYWSKFGLWIAEAYDMDGIKAADEKKELGDLRYEFARDVGTGYDYLNLPEQAVVAMKKAESLIPAFNQEGYKADISRNKSNAIAKSNRFPISEPENLTDLCLTVYEKRSHGLNMLLSQEAKARAYIAHGIGQKSNRSLRKAEKILRDVQPLLDKTPLVGAMHRVIVTKTIAKLHKAQGNRSEYEKVTGQMLNVAKKAGLYHFYRSIMQENGLDGLEEEREVKLV